MSDLDSYAATCLEMLKGVEREDAYRSLVEADPSIVPILIKTYRAEAEPTVRATLVEIVWQHRVPEAIPFLAEAQRQSSTGLEECP